MRVIKRYANRKLYDTTGSTYITLDEIAQMIKSGEEIQIIDNKTKEDLTAVTMAQILVEEEKRERRGEGGSSLTGLRDLIQHNTALLSRRISQPVHNIRSSVEESVSKLIRTGEERAAETRDQFQGWIEQNTEALDELYKRVDDRVREAVTGLDLVGRHQKEVAQLRERVEELEALLGRKSPPPVSDTEPAEEEPTAVDPS